MEEDELRNRLHEQDGAASADGKSPGTPKSDKDWPEARLDASKQLHPFAVPAEPPPAAPECFREGPPGAPPSIAIMDWLDREMKGRLSSIDEKLSSLSYQVGICVDKLAVPSARLSQRRALEHTAARRTQMGRANTNRHSVLARDGALVSMHPTDQWKKLERQNARTASTHGGVPNFNNRRMIAERGTYLRFAGSQVGSEPDTRDRSPPGVRATTHGIARPSVHFQSVPSEISAHPTSLPSASTADSVALPRTSNSKNSIITNGTMQIIETGDADRYTYLSDAETDAGIMSTTSLGQKRQAITVQKHYPIEEKMQAFSQLPAAFKRDAVSLKERIWTFLDDPESNRWAMTYARFEKGFIIFACFVSFLQTLDPPPLKGIPAAVLETSFDVVFMIDCILRICVCPSFKGYLLSIYSWWDILSSSAFILRATQGFVLAEKESTIRTLLLCIVPIIRLLKMLRHFQQFQLLLDAFSLAFEALPVLLFTLLIITLTSASIIYMVEPRDNIDNFPKAIWLTIVTMTTVGYGDITPSNGSGSVVVAALVIGSVLFMAMPLGIIGGAFTQVWNDRDRILLIKRTRERLVKWGYAAEDIPVLFEVADADGTGEVDIEEFRSLMKNMKIGLANDRIVQLFQSFDNDCSGTIDAKEFIRNIFPGAYLDIFGNSDFNLRDTMIAPPLLESPREDMHESDLPETSTSPPRPVVVGTSFEEMVESGNRKERSTSKQSDAETSTHEPPTTPTASNGPRSFADERVAPAGKNLRWNPFRNSRQSNSS